MASRREYEMMFSLGAKLSGEFQGTFSGASKSVALLQREIDALNKAQSDIAAYQKQQGAIDATNKKLSVLSEQYDNIQKEISQTEGFSATLENRLLSKQQQIDKTTASLANQSAKLHAMGDALSRAGIDTDNLTKEQAELSEKLEETKNKQIQASQATEGFSKNLSAGLGAAASMVAAVGLSKFLSEVTKGLSECVQESMDFEEAMTGVAKTTDLTAQEFLSMSQAMKDLSTSIPMSTRDLAFVAETAGQLGIAKADLLDFTKTMAQLGTATNMTADEAATMLAQFASITQMDPKEYSRLGSTIVALGNNYATTERNIADMAQTIAAAGSIAGMSEADIAAIAAAVTSLGISAQNGATQMTKLISDMNSAVMSGENLADWARVANMSAQDFARAWGDDAASALDLFVRGLHETVLSGADVYGVLHSLGITETRMVTMLTSLAGAGDRLGSTLQTANVAWSDNIALQTEAEKRYTTTQSKLVMMQNAYSNVKVAIGDALTPVLKRLYDVATDVLKGVTSFIEKNPALVRAITVFAGVIGTAAAALIAYTAVTSAATAISSAFALATGAALGPIMLVVGAVAALAAGIVFLTSCQTEEERAVRALTASSREQHFELMELNAEYETAKARFGEYSDEAMRLRDEVDSLTREYALNRQTLEEFMAENDAIIQQNQEIIAHLRETTSSIHEEELGSLALVFALENLLTKTELTTAEQLRLKAAVDALNESVPDLALSYDEVTGSLNLSVEAMKKMVTEQAELERLRERQRTWVELVKTELVLREQLVEAQENYKAAYAEAWPRYERIGEGYSEAEKIEYTNLAVKQYIDEVDRLTSAYEENQAALAEVTAEAESYAARQEEAAQAQSELLAGMDEMKAYAESLTERMESLAIAYTESYNAALSSVQGQFKLWDEAAPAIATSIASIHSNLESQLSYWREYNDNLAALRERAGDISGLSDVIASFGDGSKESVAAIKGLAEASDKDLGKMVKKWQDLQAEQGAAAEQLAQLETDFTTVMQGLRSELESTVQDMDLGQEAAREGKKTILAYIDGAQDLLPKVKEAFAGIAYAASYALHDAFFLRGTVPGLVAPKAVAPSPSSPDFIGPSLPSHAAGLDFVPYDGYIAKLHKGERVLSSQEARLPDLQARLPGGQSGQTGTSIVVQYSPQITLPGLPAGQAGLSGGAQSSDVQADWLTAVLSENSESLRVLILDTVREAEIDARRRAYA